MNPRTFWVALFAVPSLVFANASGAIGYSGGPPNNENCNGCHTGGAAPTVVLTGPTSLGAGATGTYTLTVTGGAGVRAGMNVSVSDPNASLNPSGTNVALAFKELHQTAAVPFNGGSATFSFTLTAPPYAGMVKLFGTGNSCNGNNGTSGDRSTSTTLDVTVTPGSGQNPPAITLAAAAAQNPAQSRTVQVTVGAADDAGEANLSYTWSATGPANVTFSPNGNNAAKAATASFSAAGTYAITVTVRDGTNKTVTSSFMLPVQARYSVLRLTPAAVQVSPGAFQVFTGSARDQFDGLISPQPTVSFMLPAGGGSLLADAGMNAVNFRAQGSVGGPFVLTANANGISASSSIGVGKAPGAATDTTPPTVSLSGPSAGSTLAIGTVFEAVAADDTGVAEVSFEIGQVKVGSVTSPPWKVTYSAKVAGLTQGTQSLEAVAKDVVGNVTRSSALPIAVGADQATPDAGSGGSGGGSGGSGAGGGSGSTDGGSGAGPGGGTEMPMGGCGCNGAPELGLLGAFALTSLLRRRRWS